MPFYSPFITVSVVPHVFSRVDGNTKRIYRNKYKTFKKTVTAGTMVSVGTVEGVQLAKDILTSKIKAYGYKSLFAIAAGPIVQLISLPLYAWTYGTSIRRFALAASEIGAKITRGEMGILNWAWVGADLILFGECVSITDDSDLMIYSNETVGTVKDLMNKLVGDSE